MAISSTVRKAGPYSGDGTATQFSFDFKVFTETDIAVIRADALGVETTLVIDSDYSVTLNEDQNETPGGLVTFTAAPTAGQKVVLLSAVPDLQPVDATNQGGFYPETLNDGLDRSTIQTQQVRELLGRQLTLPVTAPADVSLALPLPVPNQLLAWGEDGKELVAYDPSGLAGVIAYGATRVDTFDGDGTTLSFTLSANPGLRNNLRISIDGVVQVPGDDFTWSAGTTLSFVQAPPAGTKIMAQYQEALVDIGGAEEAGAAAGLISGAAAGAEAAGEVVGGKADVDAANLDPSFRANARLYLNPLNYGAVGDGVADDTAALLAALNVGRTLGLPVDGVGKTYGIANFSFAPNVEIRNATFKHLAPNSGIDGDTASKVVECIGTGMNAGEWLRLSGVKVLRNGGSVSTTLYPNQGIRVLSVTTAYVDADVSGNNSGELIKIDTVKRVYLNVNAHDAGYVHSTQTNDTIEGVVLSNVEAAFGNVSIDRLGRTDLTSAQRWRYSRGLTLDRVGGGALNVKITRCEQPIDASGLGSSSNLKISGYIGYCFTNGVKLAHAHHADNIANVKAEHIGRYGVLVAGPNDGEALPYQQNLRVSGLSISEIGSNGYYDGLGQDTAGVVLERNSALAVRNQFPKNVVVEGNVITSYTGSVVVTRSANSLVMADGSFPVSTCKPVTFSTTGTLPSPLVAGTTYWLGWDQAGLAVQVASSYNNAEDGVFLTLTTAGTGTHTMTGKSFMRYRGLVTSGAVKDRAAPNYFRENQGGGATIADNSGFAGRAAYIPTSNGQSVADGSGFVDVILNGVGRVDPDAIYNTSTGVFTLTQGVWSINALIAYVANASGIRDVRVMVDTGSGFTTTPAFPAVRVNSSSGSDTTDVSVRETLVVGPAGANLKFQTQQSSGGGALSTHPNSRASVVRITS